jgi:hypothetical protein
MAPRLALPFAVGFVLLCAACGSASSSQEDTTEGALAEGTCTPSLAGLELGVAAVEGEPAIAIQKAIAPKAKKRDDVSGATYVGLLSVGPDGEPAVFGVQCIDGEVVFGGRPGSNPESIACALTTIVRGRASAPLSAEGDIAKLVHDALPDAGGVARSVGPLSCTTAASGTRCELRADEVYSIALDDPAKRGRMPEREALAIAAKVLPASASCAR